VNAISRQTTFLVLVRHAESLPSQDVADQDWPLSEAGHVQSRQALIGALSRRSSLC
jgi:phosphohistidine phosphatase SixA